METVVIFSGDVRPLLEILWGYVESSFEGLIIPRLRVFELKKNARDGMDGGYFLVRKGPTCLPRTSMFYWTIRIQFFPNPGMSPPKRLCLIERLLNYEFQ